MKILILSGSPHRQGTTHTLISEFTRGAQEAGHEVRLFDCAAAALQPCKGCDACAGSGICVHKDSGNEMLQMVLESDALVFATPIYYFGMCAQLKLAMDRFYARNAEIMEKPLKGMVIAAAADGDPDVMRTLRNHIQQNFEYLKIEDCGSALACGAFTAKDLTAAQLQAAYDLGKQL